MPQASDELRAWAIERFGSLDSDPVIQWLEAQGFELHADSFGWKVPPKLDRPLSSDESKAISFLIREWDFSGLIIDDESAKFAPHAIAMWC